MSMLQRAIGIALVPIFAYGIMSCWSEPASSCPPAEDMETEINLGGAREVKATIRESENDYSVRVSFIPVRAFDQPKNSKVNRMKAEQYGLRALSLKLKAQEQEGAGEDPREFIFDVSGTTLRTIEEDDTSYIAKLQLPKEGIRLTQDPGDKKIQESTPPETIKKQKSRKDEDRFEGLFTEETSKLSDMIQKKKMDDATINQMEEHFKKELGQIHATLCLHKEAELGEMAELREDLQIDEDAQQLRNFIDDEYLAFLDEVEAEKRILPTILSDFERKIRTLREALFVDIQDGIVKLQGSSANDNNEE